jgi:hypothetical protein
VSEQSRLESANGALSCELSRSDSEMEAVRSRLLVALHEVDVAKEAKAEDERRIAILNSACARMANER